MTKRGTDVSEGWRRLAELTPARIALGRSRRRAADARGAEVRDGPCPGARRGAHAVRRPGLAGRVEALGLAAVEVTSAAPAREVYLRRPDLGRRLDQASAAALDGLRAKPADLVVVIADGLSSTAVEANAVPLLHALTPHLTPMQVSLGPVVIATGARVALGDEIGTRLRARMVLVLIGERPGLSSPDSLGAYLTFGPRVGAQRRRAELCLQYPGRGDSATTSPRSSSPG